MGIPSSQQTLSLPLVREGSVGYSVIPFIHFPVMMYKCIYLVGGGEHLIRGMDVHRGASKGDET